MCLYNAKVCVRKLFGKKKEEIDCWKVVRKGMTSRTKWNIYPLFYNTMNKYELGETYRSNRRSKRTKGKDDWYSLSCIYKGVHVFTDYEQAKIYCEPGELVVKVKCRRSDYVAHNSKEKQAVFMAVEFPKEITAGG